MVCRAKECTEIEMNSSWLRVAWAWGIRMFLGSFTFSYCLFIVVSLFLDDIRFWDACLNFASHLPSNNIQKYLNLFYTFLCFVSLKYVTADACFDVHVLLRRRKKKHFSLHDFVKNITCVTFRMTNIMALNVQNSSATGFPFRLWAETFS